MFLLFTISVIVSLLFWKGVKRMIFNEDSICVKVWFTAVASGTYTYEQVPNLLNLREEVGKKLEQMGYPTGSAV